MSQHRRHIDKHVPYSDIKKIHQEIESQRLVVPFMPHKRPSYQTFDVKIRDWSRACVRFNQIVEKDLLRRLVDDEDR